MRQSLRMFATIVRLESGMRTKAGLSVDRSEFILWFTP